MIPYCSFFYGDLDDKGYEISYLLVSRNIKHEYIYLTSDYLFVLKTQRKLREISGFDEIKTYIMQYAYIFEFPEVEQWH